MSQRASAIAFAALAASGCGHHDKHSCNPAIAEGATYKVLLVERVTDEAPPPSSVFVSCGDALDLAPGNSFEVQALELTATPPHGGCSDRWGAPSGIPALVFGARLGIRDDWAAQTLRMNYEVTINGGCEGKWSGQIDAPSGQEFDKAVLGAPPYVKFTRWFAATSSPESCGLRQPSCLDKFAIEITPQ